MRKSVWRRHLSLFLLGIGFLVVLIGTLGGLFFAFELQKAAAKIPQLPNIIAQIAKQPTTIVSADGTVLFSMTSEYRKPVRIRDVPEFVKNATIAAEDRRFYQHDGVDYFALLRGLFTNVREGRFAQGGSTLTMQIAKRIYSTGEKTFSRKLQDMALAIMMERELQKDQILELYLNQVYYGTGAYGIQAAAEIYFDKTLNRLTLGEAALLARLVRRPSEENPYKNPERAIENRNYVLRVMLEENMIDESQYEKAIQEKLVLQPRKRYFATTSRKHAPYFVDYVLDRVRHELPDFDLGAGGCRIETTLNYRMQEIVEAVVEETLRRFSGKGVRTAAFLMTDRQGKILAMVGGGDYRRNQYNMVTQGRRLPGSAFKPIVYAIALETGSIRPNDLISNERYYWTDTTTGKVWAPRNHNGRYGGYVSIRTAFSQSINMPAIRVAEKTGGSNIVALARSLFGFTSPLDPGLAIALGCSAVSPMEMVQAYSVFMLSGDRMTPYGIQKIVGPDGTVLMEFKPFIKKGVLSSATAATIDSLERAVVTEGTARKALGVFNARGKTGTTTNHLDAWFCGYTDELLGVVWVANEVSNRVYKPMAGVYGGTVPVEMWATIMSKAQRLIGEQPKAEFVKQPKNEGPQPVQGEVSQQTEEKGTEENQVPSSTVDALPQEESSEPSLPEQVKSEQGQAVPIGTPRGVQRGAQKEEPLMKNSQHTSNKAMVEICVRSGKRASARCPGVKMKTFQVGEEPEEHCLFPH